MMGPKRILNTPEVNVKKKIRKPLSIAQKLDIIERLENGERAAAICASMNLASSTVRTVYLQKGKLVEFAGTCIDGAKLARITRKRDTIMEKLEKLLTDWIESHNQRNVNLGFLVIREKALALFKELKKKAEEEGTVDVKDLEFKASQGWFERYKNRTNLRNFRTMDDSTSTDMETTKAFLKDLQKIIEEGGYSPKQIFNIKETGLFWKRLPSQTFISQEEQITPGFKVSKDHITLLLGSNLEGDVQLKPLLIYHSQNPRALKGLNKAALPVIWRFNRKATVTMSVFAEYLTGYFSPFVASYCVTRNLSNKALLIIDSAPGHTVNVEDYADNIRFVFLPPSTLPSYQPMDQGIISAFNVHYLHLVMQYLTEGSDGENKRTLRELWQDYNIKMAIENIATAWTTVTETNTNAAWRSLLPKYAHDSQDFFNMIEDTERNIMQLAHEAGFAEVDQNDIHGLLNSHSEKLTNEELLQLEFERPIEDEEDDDEAMRTLDTKTLSLLFSTCEKAIQIADDNDPQMERSSAFKRKMNDAISCYRELYNTKKKAGIQTMSPYLCYDQLGDSQPSTSNDAQFCMAEIKLEVLSSNED